MRLSICSLALVLSLPAAVPAADLVVRQRVTTAGAAPTTREHTEYLTATRNVTEGADDRMIADLQTKTFTLIDKKEKTYWVLPFETIRAQSEALRKRMEALPPEAKKMMGGDVPPRVAATGKTAKIAGYQATEHKVEGGSITGSVWVTDAVVPPARPEDWDEVVPQQGAARQLAQAMKSVKGFPLRTVLVVAMGPMKTTVTTETLDVREGSPPADVMTVPEGFRKVEAPDFTGQAAKKQ